MRPTIEPLGAENVLYSARAARCSREPADYTEALPTLNAENAANSITPAGGGLFGDDAIVTGRLVSQGIDFLIESVHG